MRAVVIREPGEPEVLELQAVDTPQPGGAEVRIRVHAAGLNRADLLQRRGLYPPPPGVDERIPGLEYAGVVEALGPRTVSAQVGDRVMGLTGGAACADYVVVHERELLPVPADIPFTEAAAIPEVFMTAWRALFVEGGLRRGQWALVRAATSGVGQAAIQLIHALDARSIGTSRSAERLAKLQALGMDIGHVDGEGELTEVVRAADGEGVDVVLDLLGGGALQANLDALRPEGRMVVIGLLGGLDDRLDFTRLLMKRLTVQAMTMRSLPLERRIVLAVRFSSEILPLFEAGKLKPQVDSVYPLDAAADAHRHMENSGHFGKVILDLG